MCSNQPKMRGNSPGIRFNITQLGHNTISRPRLLLNGWNGTETLSTTGKLSTLPTTLERPGPIPTSQFTAFDGRLCYKPKEHKALIRWEKSKWTDLVHQMLNTFWDVNHIISPQNSPVVLLFTFHQMINSRNALKELYEDVSCYMSAVICLTYLTYFYRSSYFNQTDIITVLPKFH